MTNNYLKFIGYEGAMKIMIYGKKQNNSILEVLKKSTDLYKKQLAYVEEQNHIAQLLFKDLINTIKCNVEYPALFSTFIHNAYNYLSFKSNYKKNGTEHKQFMDFETLFKSVLLDGENVENYELTVTSIYQGCFDCRFYKIYFTINNCNMALSVPNIKALTEDNFQDAYKGKCTLFENEVAGVTNYLISTYIFEEIKPILIEYIKKKTV